MLIRPKASPRFEMEKICVHCLVVALIFWTACLDLGCSKEKSVDQYLIRVLDKEISTFEFKQAVETAREEAFPGVRHIDPEVMSRLQVQVLNQLTEELIILVHGENLGLQISEPELNQNIARIKADYPDNTFDETLLENAVSFTLWKDKLAKRLMVEKVITKELIDKVQLSSEDIAEYYQKLQKNTAPDQQLSDDQHERMVLQLRRMKAEEAYQQWIDGLREQYPVDINRRQWEKLVNEEKD